MTAQTAIEEPGGRVSCWCCGQKQPETSVVRLGDHPEVAVCLPCAHFLHLQARGREDALRTSPAARVRDALRFARGFVIRRGWHRKAGIGPLLRQLGRHTPWTAEARTTAVRRRDDLRAVRLRRSPFRGRLGCSGTLRV